MSRSRRPATALTAGRPPSYGKLGEDGPERARDKHMGVCRMVTGRVHRRSRKARDGGRYIYVIYAECSRSWQIHHRCASPPRGRCHPEPPPQRGEMEIGQDGRGTHSVGIAPDLYDNIYYIQKYYESVVMSSQMVDQTSLPPALVHKALLRISRPRQRALMAQRDSRPKRDHRSSERLSGNPSATLCLYQAAFLR